MKISISLLVVTAALAFTGLAFADHDKSCKNIHGKVTVVTQDGITVNDKMYKVGKTTRITKGEKVVKLDTISTGDLVCVDARGKDDIGNGEVASVAVLEVKDKEPVVLEKKYVRETVEKVAHDKNCPHLHGKVTRVEESTLTVDGKPYLVRETTHFLKGDQAATIKTVQTGDFVCLDDDKSADHKVTTVVVLAPSDAAPFEREIIREKIGERK